MRQDDIAGHFHFAAKALRAFAFYIGVLVKARMMPFVVRWFFLAKTNEQQTSRISFFLFLLFLTLDQRHEL